MTLSGTAQNCQTLTEVSGGVRGKSRTFYISLLRIDGQQVRFSSSKPISISDGDLVVVSGRTWRNELNALALKNCTTGAVAHSGVVERIVSGILLPIFGIPFCFIASMILGEYSLWLYGTFLVASLWQFYRAVTTQIALANVKATSSNPTPQETAMENVEQS